MQFWTSSDAKSILLPPSLLLGQPSVLFHAMLIPDILAVSLSSLIFFRGADGMWA